MYFLDKRIKVICDELKKLSIKAKSPITTLKIKEGFYLTPEEAENNSLAWHSFDSSKEFWTGRDKHYWFKTVIKTPQEFANCVMQLRICTQIEEWDDAKNPQFLIFLDNKLVQGADMNHRDVLITEKAIAEKEYNLDIQAYTGILHSQFNMICSLELLDKETEGLYYDLIVPLQAFPRLDKEDPARYKLEKVLNDTINLLDLRTPYSPEYYTSLKAAREYIAKALYIDLAGHEEVIASCIGHTHIDVAWWWTVAQTREKVARSFSTVLNLMEQYPNYKFMSSQPVLYQFLKERYPDSYEKIKARIKEERWEGEGGMWLEADCNLTSGESLVRQFMHGKRFFKEEFNLDNRILWLPDVFGYSGALPQIMKKCGIDYFMTTKLNWNQFDRMPHDTFNWKGIDGSQVLTHLVTTLGIDQPLTSFFTTYNGMLHPNAIIGGWQRYQDKDINNDILVCYGYGDGGGGPTKEMLETSLRMEKGIVGLPKVRQVSSLQYFEELEQRVKDNNRLSTWEGELYFEYHRGTLTSMARNKRSNRKAELKMMDTELLSLLAKLNNHDTLYKMWDTILLNQFHDILPGSSIHEVYEVTKAEYEQLNKEIDAVEETALNKLVDKKENKLTIFNTTGFERSDVVSVEIKEGILKDLQGHLYPIQNHKVFVEDLPPKGYKVFELLSPLKESVEPFTNKYEVETPFYHVTFDKTGAIKSLFDKEEKREVFTEKGGNNFVMYEDKPIYYDNWDIDIYYTEKSWECKNLTKFEWLEKGSVASVLYLEIEESKSLIKQWIYFYNNIKRIDFKTVVDWKEHQTLLKVEFDTDLHTDEATYEVQFGNLKRKTHKNTSWDIARFEACGQKWVDVSEGHYGVSLINDCKYGHAISNGKIGLSLIKSGIEPNPVTDQELHYFTYSLLPHKESWAAAGTVKQAYFVNQEAITCLGATKQNEYSFVNTDKANVVIETVKESEDKQAFIIRVYESENARTNFTLKFASLLESVTLCNLIEEPIESVSFNNSSFTTTIKPYEVLTFKVNFR